MSNEVRSREENGFMVFEKDKLDDLEIKFFNPEYFSKIGFSDAEIRIVNKTTGEELTSNDSDVISEPPPSEDENPSAYSISQEEEKAAQEEAQNEAPVDQNTYPPDPESSTEVNVGSLEKEDGRVNEIKGGDYANVESLTIPFRYFVYLVQTRYNKNREPPREVPSSNSEEKKSSVFNSFYDRIKNTFSGNNTANKSSSQNEPVNVSNPIVEQNESDYNTATPENTNNDNDAISKSASPASEDDMSLMWVVKIPITENEESNQIGEYKKEELQFNQRLREYKMEKINNIIVTGKMFNIGNNRFLKVAQTVKEGQPKLEVNHTKLIGTKMSKYEIK